MNMELRCGHIRIVISPRERSHESPESIRCEADAVISHPTGFFRYQANDIYWDVDELAAFGRSLEALIAGSAREASLCCVSKFFRLNVTRDGSAICLTVEMEDYVPNMSNPKLIGCSTEDNGELLSRWRDQIQETLNFED